METLCVRAN